MATVFELPDELDLPAADQSQPADIEVCDVLADSVEAVEAADTEADTTEPETGTVAGDAPPTDISEGQQDPQSDPQPESEGAAGTALEASLSPAAVETQADSASAVTVTVTPWQVGQAAEMVNLVDCITDAEQDCCAAETLMDDLKERLKEAKKHYEMCVKRLRTFARELDRKSTPRPAKSASVTAEPLSKQDPYIAANPYIAEVPVTEEPSSSPPEDDSWRSVPLTEIGIDSIKGLGTKKIEALLDLCPTLGAFEDLRAKVGRDAASLPELMPKGIGEQACDALEEMVLDWIARARKPAPAPMDVVPVETSHASQIEHRAADLDNGQPNCLANKQADDTLWKGGYRSFEEGVAITECPWMPGDNQDEWLRGFLAARSVDAHERARQEMAEDEAIQDTAEPEQPEQEQVPFDIDSL